MVNDDTPMMEDDAKLLAEARRGDQYAFATLARRHRQWAVTYARKLGAGDDAEDIAHDAFFQLLRRPPATLQSDSLRSLLSVDLRYRVLHLGRSRGRIAPVDPRPATPSPASAPSEIARRHRIVDCVIEAIDELATVERELMHLRYVDGLEPVEIAELTGRSAPAVRGILFRAVRTLRVDLGLSR